MSQTSPNLYGFPTPISTVFPAPVRAQRAPTTSDIQYPIGQLWVDEVGDDYYGLVDVTAGVATWNVLATTPGNVDTLTGDTGGAITPTGGDIGVKGTANQITTTGSGHTITWSLPSAITAPGSLTTTTTLAATTTVTAGTGITATTGDITATNGNLVANTAGKGLKIKEGSNARMGSATLVAGTVTVANTSVTANTRFFFQRSSAGTATYLGLPCPGTVTPNTSFVINSLNPTTQLVEESDTSVITWLLIEAA